MKTLALTLCLFTTAAHAAPALIGGEVATSDALPSTLRLDGGCTAAKVAPRVVLTAAHCLVDHEAPHLIHADYVVGAKSRFQNHRGLDVQVPVAGVFIHPSYLLRLAGRFTAGLSVAGVAFEAYDAAFLVLEQDLPEVPSAPLSFEPVLPGDEVEIGGWGCENSTMDGPGERRLKTFTTRVIPTEVVPEDSLRSPLRPFRVPSRAAAFNFFTPGRTLEENAASICPGDSGGPVYRGGSVVGVNAQYTFRDDSAISSANLHARLSGVEAWAREILALASVEEVP